MLTIYIHVILVAIVSAGISSVKEKSCPENVTVYSPKSLELNIITNSMLATLIDQHKSACPRTYWLCKTCYDTFKAILDMIRSVMDIKVLEHYWMLLCSYRNDMIYCRRLIFMYMEPLQFMVRENHAMTSSKMCALLLQNWNCFKWARDNWTVPIPSGESQVYQGDAKTEKILHLSHINYNSLYSVEADAECTFPACCMQNVTGGGDRPGMFGSYSNCDMPLVAVEGLFDRLKNITDINYVYFTGGVMFRREWDTSAAMVKDALNFFYPKLDETFKKIPVYPVLGRLDTHPSYLMSREFTKWLFDQLAESWRKFLPKTALWTVRKGGYYTAFVRKGLRVVGLNSAVCGISNMRNIKSSDDPFDQLLWLTGVLHRAEMRKQHVHIISTMPPGSSECVASWTHSYYNIVYRFRNTITAQFSGDEYYNGIRLFYDPENKEPINIAFGGGSFSSFVSKNPSYLIHTIDGPEAKVKDFQLFYLDLNKTNEVKNMTWVDGYTFATQFKIADVSLKEVDKFVKELAKNEQMGNDYKQFQFALSPKTGNCSDNCRENIVCSMVTVKVGDETKCDELLAPGNQTTLPPGSTTTGTGTTDTTITTSTTSTTTTTPTPPGNRRRKREVMDKDRLNSQVKEGRRKKNGKNKKMNKPSDRHRKSEITKKKKKKMRVQSSKNNHQKS